MQMKGMVRVFAALMIIFSFYQLSFSWFVKSHEAKMLAKAERQVKAGMPAAAAKYPTNAEARGLYEDTLKEAIRIRNQRLLDSTAKQTITWFGQDYKFAKDQEAKLGLDLQGGMNVTLEVGMADLLRSLSAYSKDKAFTQALTKAVAEKNTGGKDLIDLFVANYRTAAPGSKLAPLFLANSNKRITVESSDDAVISYIRKEADAAFENTSNILRKRIDRFGVASPTINPDKNKKIITVELAGLTDRERVRKYLQSTANLQFFELYDINEIGQSLLAGEKALAASLNGTKSAVKDTTVNKADTTANGVAKADSPGAAKKDTSMAAAAKEAPIRALMQIFQPEQDPTTGRPLFRSALGIVAAKDTAVLGEYLRNPLVASQFPQNLKFAFGYSGGNDERTNGIYALYALKTVDGSRSKLEGDRVNDARQDFDERGKVSINMGMDNQGAKIWAKMTEANVGKGIAIVLDDFVYTAPTVNGVIPNGSSVITGSYEVKEAQDMAEMLKSGKLPAPAKIVQEQVVGPTLGAEAVSGGTMAFTISFVLIFVLMLAYYNNAGWVANISLILNLLFTISILTAFGATFTAAGIAGLVLTIGMAVDTNVIVFERIKEELTAGRNYPTAVANGYKRSLAPVLDAHVTTFLTAAILYYFGLGPVRGFAYVQMWGIVLNLFCGILISRTLTDWFTSKSRHLEYFTGASRRIFKHAKYKFIEFRKVAYAISIGVLVLGVASLFYGFDKGVEFSGGYSYTIRFDKPVKPDEVRNDLQKVFAEYPVVKTIGSNNQLDITTAYKIEESNADSVVERALYSGLQKHLPAGLSYEDFDNAYKVGSQKVLPTISEDLRRGAIYATLFSMLIIVAYIFIRFRDWRYSLGTIVALLHDVLVTLAVFSFLRKVVPFPLEIDQHFIAAVLTVIGFSMNDTIIVFDRIRENSGLMPNADRGTIINKSINDTLSRTIMTSLTVFLTILILFIVGGEVTRGFAFAMLIGVITGTYSSIFVAAPILVDFGKSRPLGAPEPVAAVDKKAKLVTGK
ncbi:MAG: protein translocase subunit SecDF [Bacteroidetes bacterium]|nr:MAG: protein translocase subunit SecDF [Bacteroidota bacterium]